VAALGRTAVFLMTGRASKHRFIARSVLSGLLMAVCSQSIRATDFVHPDAAVRFDLQHVQRGTAAQRAADGIEQLPMIFQPAASPTITLAPSSGAWNWSGQGELHLRVQNGMGWAVTLVVDIDGGGEGQRLHAVVGIPAGPAQTLVVPLHATSPRAFGMQVGPPMPWADGGRNVLVATTVEGQLDLHAVRDVKLSMPAPSAPQTLLFGTVEPVTGDALLKQGYTGIVDGYGQYTRGEWPEKIASDAALKAAASSEAAQLASWSKPASGEDRYGGRVDVPGLTSTGWFHTEKRDGRWWLVTPLGHAFFSLGVNAVAADGGRSYVQGREFMFSGLPVASGAFASFFGQADSRSDAGSQRDNRFNDGRWFDFYGANLQRTFGRDWNAAWRSRTLDRLIAWNFNTLGNWSDPALPRAQRISYTVPILIRGDYNTVSTGYDYWGRMPDPFDPRFVAATEKAVGDAVRGVRDDPWLLGYFADNELAWAGMGAQGRWALAVGSLAQGPQSPAKQAFIAQLKKKYVDPGKLAAAWGVSLASWDGLAAAGFVAPAPQEAHPAMTDDYIGFLRLYADTYFRTVAGVLKKHDPHHLFLGGRLAVRTPEVEAACAQWCDVVSINMYTDLPQHGFDVAAMQKHDKPVLITEFHFGSADRGPFGSGVAAVASEEQRGQAYARFMEAAANTGIVVGAHWFQYTDQPVTGRVLDGENSHIGLVGITDIPFAGFVRAARAANRKVLGLTP
jgi:hypothetical protein